jgi:hypothetical protein
MELNVYALEKLSAQRQQEIEIASNNAWKWNASKKVLASGCASSKGFHLKEFSEKSKNCLLQLLIQKIACDASTYYKSGIQSV